jgi:cysteine desulfurase
MVYLDHNATTPLDPRVLEAMLPYLGRFYGNPSALHRLGRLSRGAIDRAREQVGALVAVRPEQVIFTSGGTEASNLALWGLSQRFSTARLLSGQTEHPCVAEPLEALARARGWTLDYLPITPGGQHGLPSDEIFSKGPVIAALMLANNETGVIEHPQALGERLRAQGGLLHVDGVQAAGKIPLDFAGTGAHSLTLSAHKIRGPKGVGALILDPEVRISPITWGGGQERGLRPGTENVAGIVGFGIAAELAKHELDVRAAHLLSLRHQLEWGLSELSGVTFHAAESPRLPNTIQFSFEGWDGEALVMALDREGFQLSSGSACASGGNEPSPVLMAMGVAADLARGAIRVSLGVENTAPEIDSFLKALKGLSRASDQVQE